MSKLTAIEILEIKLLGIVSFDSEVLRNKYKEQFKIAKEMEKEQRIDDIVQFGIKYEHKYSQMEIIKLCESAEQYYNETYKKEEK